MNKTLNTLLGAMLLASSASAFAASSVDLTVTGLITPSACTPTLANGGVVDHGKISAKDLKVDIFTTLETKTVQLNVNCDAATLMALEPQDNRPGSAIGSTTSNFGLGLINGTEKLGAVQLRLRDPIADNVPARIIRSTDGGASWTESFAMYPSQLSSVADSSTVAPLPLQSLTANLEVVTFIAATRELTLTNEVSIDGSLTLTVRYL